MDPFKPSEGGVVFDAAIGFAREWEAMTKPFWVVAIRRHEAAATLEFSAWRMAPSPYKQPPASPQHSLMGPPGLKVSLQLAGVRVNKMRGRLVFASESDQAHAELESARGIFAAIAKGEHVFVMDATGKRDLLAAPDDPLGTVYGRFVFLLDDMLLLMMTDWPRDNMQELAARVELDAPQNADGDAAVMVRLLRRLRDDL